MEYNKLVQGEALSRDKFKKPSIEFGIMPFWFWNGEMNYEEMEYQMREFIAKGIPGIYIHARFGILESIGYLTEDWFDRVRFTIDKARDIGLQVWLYDEYNWPSGTAGKQVIKRKPELIQKYLELVEVDVSGQYFQFMEGTDSRYNDLEESEPVYACAILLEDLEKGNPNFINLMPNLVFDKVISWEAPKGLWKVFYFIERKASWYVDVLNNETTNEFLNTTHMKYKEKLGEMTAEIRGFYTDEPAMFYFEVARDNFAIPWSTNMLKIFKQYNGYDLRKLLPHLYYDIGKVSEQVRYDFYSALTKQYEQSFYKEISNWCKKNNMIFTGHLLFEESLRLHSRTGGNLFKHLRHFDLTGVDHLYPRVGNREMPNEHVAIKMASSAAHQYGRKRLLCESMGGSYWDCTMERMKWIADWEYVLGVNLLNPHGFHYSIEGERKRDWPPSQFYHHTWWNHYKSFSNYISRLGYLLSGGKHVCKIAILYPINSIWATYTPQKRNKIGNTIENDFNYITDRLLRLHMDFDYLDEDIMAECTIENGKLCIEDEKYEVLILPAVSHIKATTLSVCEDFVKDGGKIIADALLPYCCIDGRVDNFRARIQDLFGTSPDYVNQSFLSGEAEKFRISHVSHGCKEGAAILIEGPSLAEGDGCDILKDAMLMCIAPEIEISSDEVFYLHREKDGQDIYFLVNPTDTDLAVKISIDGEFTPELWNSLDGSIEEIKVYKYENGKTTFNHKLYSFGSVIISVSPFRVGPKVIQSDIIIEEICDTFVKGYGCLNKDGNITVINDRKEKVIKLNSMEVLNNLCLNGKWRVKTDRPNAIVTDSWKVTFDRGQCPLELSKSVNNFNNFYDFRMGAWEAQLPEDCNIDNYPIKLWYVTEIHAEFVPVDLRIMIDGFKGSEYKLYVNGNAVKAEPLRSYLDAEIKEISIAELFHEGENTIAVLLTVNKKSDGIVDLLKIVGTFSVFDKNGIETICPVNETIETGDFTRQGYPYYSGTMEYTREFMLPESFQEHKLILTANVGTDILEVVVNGVEAGVSLWKPYEIDVTKYIKRGENSLTVKVVNTLNNILEGVKQRSGLFEIELIPYNIYKIEI